MEKYSELKKYMLEFGYKIKAINKIINILSKLTEETMFRNIKRNSAFFLDMGYERDQIIRMSTLNPIVYSLAIETIKSKINDMINLGYTKDQIIKLSIILPAIYGLSVESMEKKINSMIKIGYTRDQVIKMTLKVPSIYSHSIETIENKINELIKLGYTKEEVIQLTVKTPIYSYSIETIESKIHDIMKLGYTKLEVIHMSIKFPAIYSLRIDSLEERIGFYQDKNFDFWIKTDPKNLIQSVQLSYARYCFFKEDGIDFSQNNYKRLFVSEKQFIRTYNKTNQQLIQKYNYDEYLNEKEVKKDAKL